MGLCRTYFKNVFWPNIFVGTSFLPRCGIPRPILQSLWVIILDIQQYASGYDPQRLLDQTGSPAKREKLGSAAILNQNPIFEIGSRLFETYHGGLSDPDKSDSPPHRRRGRKGFYIKIFSLRPLCLCGEFYKNDRSTLSFDPEAFDGRLPMGGSRRAEFLL